MGAGKRSCSEAINMTVTALIKYPARRGHRCGTQRTSSLSLKTKRIGNKIFLLLVWEEYNCILWF